MDLLFILQNTVGHLYWKDRAGRYLGANHRFVKLAGFENVESLIGKTDRTLFSSVMSSKKLALLEETDKRIMISGIGESLKEEGINANGDTAFYMTQKMPLFNEHGDIEGIMGASLDITKEIQAELARTEFLENMRHDIRTPLTGIVGFANILKLEIKDMRIKDYADNLVTSSHALLELLDEVLETVRVSSGEVPILKKKFNLKETLEQIIALNTAKARQKNLVLSLVLDEQLPRYVVGDKIRIHRIAQELVANALNFTDSGFVKLDVQLARQQNHEIVIQMTVQDSGIGIPKDKQQDIYLQFKRLSPSYKGIYKGAGLGLYVVKQFIEELEGEIYVNSAPQQGSTFSCLIPIHASLLDNATGVEDSALDKKKDEQLTIHPPSYRILLVEDHLVAQAVVKTYLMQLDCKVDIADCGHQAITMWQSNQYDLILLDIGLPDIDGYEVAKQIRIQEIAKDQHIPMIALTAHVGEENQQRCIQSGMNDVINKPISHAQCQHIIESLAKRNLSLFELTHFPLFDLDDALKNTGNETVLKDVLNLLVKQSLPEDMQALQKAYHLRDWFQVQAIVHKIKGAAVYVGTIRMKMACQYLEHYYKSGQHETLDTISQQTLTVIEQSIIEVQDWINRKAISRL